MCPRAHSSGYNIIVRYEKSNWSSSTVSAYKIMLFGDFFSSMKISSFEWQEMMILFNKQEMISNRRMTCFKTPTL